MKKKIKTIIYFIAIYFIFQFIFPVTGDNIVYADTLRIKTYNEAENLPVETIENSEYETMETEVAVSANIKMAEPAERNLAETSDNEEVNTLNSEEQTSDTIKSDTIEIGKSGTDETPDGTLDENHEGENQGTYINQGEETEKPIGDEVDTPEESLKETPVNDVVTPLADEEKLMDTMENVAARAVNLSEDIDGNGIVNQADLDIVAAKYNSFKGQAGYDPRCDLNGDGIIDIYDLTLVSKNIYTKNVIKGTVTADVLNVRSGPGTGYNIIGSLKNGNIVEIVDESKGGWYGIMFNSGTGYVSAEYITKNQDEGGTNIPSSGKKIVIDPGHGGTDPGAVGPTGKQEKDVTLKVGLKVRDLLQSYGFTVIMTRTGDYRLDENPSTDLLKRAKVANDNNADLFVSIHSNSFSDPSANGTETFYYTSEPIGSTAQKLASSIQGKLVSALGLANRRVEPNNLSVLRNTNMPAVLTELAFISNPKEEALLITNDFQDKAARAIVEGILACVK